MTEKFNAREYARVKGRRYEIPMFDSAQSALIESLRSIALAWHEPLAKANMIAMLEIIDELKKPLDNGAGK